MAKEEKDLVTRPSNTAISTRETIPDYISKGHGMEDVQKTDIALPRLGLCQALSPQKKRSDPLYIPNLEEGQMFNTVTGKIYGTTIDVIPVLFGRSRIKFYPLDEGGGIHCQSQNGIDGGILSPVCEKNGVPVCKYAVFTLDAEGEKHNPDCQFFHNRLVWLPDHAELIVQSFKSSGLRESRNWVGLSQLVGADLFAKRYKINVVEIKKNTFSWFGMKVSATAGWVPKDVYEFAKSQYESAASKPIVMDTRDMAQETEHTIESFETAGM